MPVSGDDRVAVAAKHLMDQSIHLLDSHSVGIGMVESADSLVEIRSRDQWNICRNGRRSRIEWMIGKDMAIDRGPPTGLSKGAREAKVEA